MTLALIALTVLAVVIFAFVLEPVFRARGDRAVLDAAVLPEPASELRDDPLDDVDEDLVATQAEERPGGRRVSMDQPAGSDVS